MKEKSYPIFNNQKGSSLVGALVAMMLLAAGAASISQISVSETNSSAHETLRSQVDGVKEAGLQHAIATLQNGISPDGTYSFSCGQFSITTDPQNNTIASVGTCGDAERQAAVHADFSKDCISWDTSNAYVENNKLCGLNLVKTCHNNITVTAFDIEWNWHNCINSYNANVNDIERNCALDDYSAHVTQVALANNLVYNGEIPYVGTPELGAEAGELITITATNFSSNQAYALEDASYCIDFDQNPPVYGDIAGYYTIRAHFADGSSIQDSFIAAAASQESDFAVNDDGELEVGANQNMEIEVLGSSITCGANGPEVDVNVELGRRNGNEIMYVGLYNALDVDGGEVFSSNVGGERVTYCIKAHATRAGCIQRAYACQDRLQVLNLVKGDEAPALQGFGGQQPVRDFLDPYLDADGRIDIESNQVLTLFELGTNRNMYPGHRAADFQDLVLLTTIGDEAIE